MSLQVGTDVRGRGQRALAISVIVHVGLAACLAAVTLRGKHVVLAPQGRVAPTPHVELVPVPTAEPIEVAFIELEPPATPGVAPGVASAHAAVTRPQGQRIAASSGSSEVTATSSSETHTDGGHDMMHMRGPDLGLDPASAQRIATTGAHELPQEPKVSGKLESQPGGRAVIYDRVTTMTVDPDGKAHFRDKKDIDVHFHLPIPHIDVEGMRRDAGELLTKWYADPYAGTRYGRSQDLSNINLAVPGQCDDWASVGCDDPLAPGAAEERARKVKQSGGSFLGGAADISAWLQRKYVGDPYASRKLKLLDDTRDERAARGAKYRAEQLVRSAELIDRNLARLAATKMSPIERRAALFELWDECAEGEAEGDEEAAQAGQRARAQVIGWIRKHLPKGSPDGFTDEEIATLAAHRSSKQPFEPY